MSKLYVSIQNKNCKDPYHSVFFESMSQEYGVVRVKPHKKIIIESGTPIEQYALTLKESLFLTQIDIEPNSEYFVAWKVIFTSGTTGYFYSRLTTGDIQKGPFEPDLHQTVYDSDLKSYDDFIVKIRDRIKNKNNSYLVEKEIVDESLVKKPGFLSKVYHYFFRKKINTHTPIMI